MSDAFIEDLHGTKLLECQRVPLSLLAEFQSRRVTSIPADPKKALLNTRYGLFVTIPFKNELLPQLQPRPTMFLESGWWLFVWTLKADARWREVVKDVANMKQPLAWYLPPLCVEWQQSGEVSSFIPGDDRGALFLMSGKAATQKPVSFRVDNAFHHPIWEFGIFTPTEEPCPKGQVFLSIGS